MYKNIQISGLAALALAGVGTATKSVSNSTCIATVYTEIANCVATSTDIVLKDIYAPTASSIDLSKVKPGTKITFSGKTTFQQTDDSDFDVIRLGGSGIHVTAEPGAIIDGNGQVYWDGLGSNGGVEKPNHFFEVQKLIGGSIIENLHIQNWPVHLFHINGAKDLVIRNLYLNNSLGDAPNARSGGKAAAHNSDGFDVSSSTNVTIKNSKVYNQDDCVAVTSGENIIIDNLYCSGGHGLSIGSVGGKSNNVVNNVSFKNSKLVDSTNGARIKSNYNTTGSITNIKFSNIQLENIEDHGIIINQDYLNGGPTGIPSNGVKIDNVKFENVVGTTAELAQNYYILCGDGSCTNFTFKNVKITGGKNASSCNFPASGCPA